PSVTSITPFPATNVDGLSTLVKRCVKRLSGSSLHRSPALLSRYVSDCPRGSLHDEIDLKGVDAEGRCEQDVVAHDPREDSALLAHVLLHLDAHRPGRLERRAR